MTFPATDNINEAAAIKASELLEAEDVYNFPKEALTLAFIEGALWRADRFFKEQQEKKL